MYFLDCSRFDDVVFVRRLEWKLRLSRWAVLRGLLKVNKVQCCTNEVFYLGDHLAAQHNKADRTSAGGVEIFLQSLLHFFIHLARIQ